MNEYRIGIIMNGVTGRMGTNQHLLRSIASIIKRGIYSKGPKACNWQRKPQRHGGKNVGLMCRHWKFKTPHSA
jgi:hypothetical protein